MALAMFGPMGFPWQATLIVLFFGSFFFGFVIWAFIYMLYTERAFIFTHDGRVRYHWIRPIKDEGGNIHRHTFIQNEKLPAFKSNDESYRYRGKRAFYLYEDKAGDLHYCKLNRVDHLIRTDPETRRTATQIRLEKKAKYTNKSFWERYGNLVVGVAGLMIIFMFTYLFLQQFSNYLGQVNQVVNAVNEHSCASALERAVEGMKELCTQQVESFPIE